MDGKQRERAAKLDRRAVARLHAEIIDCADDPEKMSHHLMIEDLRNFGVEVTFKQIENALRTLGYKWKEVFLPASNSDRGKKPRQSEADEWSVFKELDKTTDAHWSIAGPDMRAVLGKIERLEETLATSGMAEYRALCDRIRSLDERATVIHTDVKRAVVESRNLRQQAKQEAGLAKERAAAIQADMKKMLEWMQTLASVASKVSKMENLLLSVFLHVVPQSVPSEKETQQ
jgi:hypothetical protein